jgi:hypothetical protein
MKKTVCAGVLLAMLGLLPMTTVSHAADFAASSQRSAAIDIGRIRAVLRLTPQQERYWHPVEAALRQLASREHSESGGLVHRISQRVVSIALNSATVARLATAARPLVAVLDDQQKRAAGQLAQEMGLGEVVMAALD